MGNITPRLHPPLTPADVAHNSKSVLAWSASFLSVFAQVARTAMALSVERIQRRWGVTAAVHVIDAARVEGTAVPRIDVGSGLGLDLVVRVPALRWIRHRDRVQQQLYIRVA